MKHTILLSILLSCLVSSGQITTKLDTLTINGGIPVPDSRGTADLLDRSSGRFDTLPKSPGFDLLYRFPKKNTIPPAGYGIAIDTFPEGLSIYPRGWAIIDTTWVFNHLDTVPVIMLLCDTVTMLYDKDTAVYDRTYGWMLTRKKERTAVNPLAFWRKGYEVRTWFSRTVGYLDEKRKPLPSSVIVWMAK